MKKLRAFNTLVQFRVIFIACCLTSLFLLSSCRSMDSAIVELDPFCLLSEDNSIYFRIPTATHSDFVKSLLCSSSYNFNEKDVDLILPKLNTICIAFGNADSSSNIQVSASGKISPILLKTVLTKNNGWQTYDSNVKNIFLRGLSNYKYYNRANLDFNFAFPSSKNFLISNDIEPLLLQFNEECEAFFNDENIKQNSPKHISNFSYEWMLKDDSNDIRFCVFRPESFFSSFLGVDINFALVAINGSLVKNTQNSYSLSMNLEFENAYVLKAASIALKLAFGKDVLLEQVDSRVLELKDINISTDKVVNMFVITK